MEEKGKEGKGRKGVTGKRARESVEEGMKTQEKEERKKPRYRFEREKAGEREKTENRQKKKDQEKEDRGKREEINIERDEVRRQKRDR